MGARQHLAGGGCRHRLTGNLLALSQADMSCHVATVTNFPDRPLLEQHRFGNVGR
jgi:hypothetical protein